jgi:hypothetical protein
MIDSSYVILAAALFDFTQKYTSKWTALMKPISTWIYIQINSQLWICHELITKILRFSYNNH